MAKKKQKNAGPVPSFHEYVIARARWCFLETKRTTGCGVGHLSNEEEEELEKGKWLCESPGSDVDLNVEDLSWLIQRIDIPDSEKERVKVVLLTLWDHQTWFNDIAILDELESALRFLGVDKERLKRPDAGESE